MQTIEQRMAERSIVLPRPPRPVGRFAHAVRAGSWLFVSGTYGTVPTDDGSDVLPLRGKLGRELSVEEGYRSARLVGLNLLAMARAELGNLNQVERVVRLAGYVNAAPGFTEAPSVLNGASDLLLEVFGPERGAHARIALPQQDLTNDAPIAAELTLLISDHTSAPAG